MLESVVFQELRELAEIIVVDNGSTDTSHQIAQCVGGKLRVRIVDAPALANLSYARNVGAAATSADKLLFADAADELAPGYVASMTAALDAHEFVTSRVDSATLNADWLRPSHGPPWQADRVETFFGFLPAAGANIGIHRGVFERVGGFAEQLAGVEDIGLSWKVQQAGCSIHFVPEAIYRYRYRDTLAGLYRQTRDWGSSHVRLYRSFRGAGMPGRTLQEAFSEWTDVLRELLTVRNKTDLACLAVRTGYCVGRLQGSIRHRTIYL